MEIGSVFNKGFGGEICNNIYGMVIGNKTANISSLALNGMHIELNRGLIRVCDLLKTDLFYNITRNVDSVRDLKRRIDGFR
jgi:hypothetical protein